MSRFWSALVRDLTPYVPGEQPVRRDGEAAPIKLNTNENPAAPSPRALEAVRQAASASLRLYPDPEATALRRTLARHHGCNPDQIFVGNGSDEVLAHSFVALLRQNRPLQFPDITYSFYPVYCGLFGIAYETVPLDAEMRIPLGDFSAGSGAIILANPNAPTGIALPRQAIDSLLQAHADKPVVIDEAYVDFGGESAVPLISRHPNLLVVQTLSKSRALAGLRVGVAIGDAALIEALNRVKNSFNSYPLGLPAQAGAIAAIEDTDWFEASRVAVIESRARLTEGLAGLGFSVLPSSANFVLATHPHHAGEALAAALKSRAILVRHFARPRLSDYLRITVGSEAECQALLSALSEILAAGN